MTGSIEVIPTLGCLACRSHNFSVIYVLSAWHARCETCGSIARLTPTGQAMTLASKSLEPGD